MLFSEHNRSCIKLAYTKQMTSGEFIWCISLLEFMVAFKLESKWKILTGKRNGYMLMSQMTRKTAC